jgi:naphthalene 1,2-dioxygenase ferredoxin component
MSTAMSTVKSDSASAAPEVQWVFATEHRLVPQNDAIPILVAGREIALYSVAGKIFATSNLCTHGNARLCDGFLEGEEIECPLHQGRFNVRSGQALCAPLTQDLRCYPVKIENGKVFLAIE